MIDAYKVFDPSEGANARIDVLRKCFSQLHTIIQGNCGEFKETDIALVHLETASMWAIKSIARNENDR